MTLPHFAAIQISEEVMPMIAVLNGGRVLETYEPGDYFVFEIHSPDTTTSPDIMSADAFTRLKTRVENAGTPVTVYTTEK